MYKHVELVQRIAEHIGSFPVRELMMRLLAIDDPEVRPAEVCSSSLYFVFFLFLTGYLVVSKR